MKNLTVRPDDSLLAAVQAASDEYMLTLRHIYDHPDGTLGRNRDALDAAFLDGIRRAEDGAIYVLGCVQIVMASTGDEGHWEGTVADWHELLTQQREREARP